MTGVRIALVQMSSVGDLYANLRKCLESMEEAAAGGANLVCFPEVQLSPFFPQYPDSDASRYLITIEHEAIRMLRDKCRELRLVALPNVYLLEGDNRYDASIVIESDGSIIGISKMVHIIQAPKFYEQSYYAPSDAGFQVYDTSVGKLGIVICCDRHFPESFRLCKLQGAQVVVIPTANHKEEQLEKFAWEVRVPAMQNELFIAMCNRVGVEGHMDFCGESIVVDPDGDIVAKADDTEQILYADLDLSFAENLQEERQYFKLRNPKFCSVR